MNNFNLVRWSLLAATVSTLALGSGCNDDGDNNPNPGTNVIGGSKGVAGSGSKAGNTGKAGAAGEGGSDAGSAGSGTGNTGNSGSNGGATSGAGSGAGGDGGAAPLPECNLPETGEDGCFNCPTTDLQYLNRCADGDCVPFDNGRLTKLNSDGSLPPLD